MDTAPLKSFATRARTDLITEVSAGVRRVLAPASRERVEQPGAVAALEKAVAAAGGGEAGRAAVADKVAYTWFNRIIALRFMDANGYTGVGVVSPARGQQGGQPEILAEAKRGTIDTTIVTNKETVETVTGLLDGTRPSDDPQGEAYALLLAEYCRHWNRAMPFMFEREGDYTELLIPANLLADDSVLARAAATLTEDVCHDVEVIGWLYQFYISERKDEVFAGFKKNKKAGAAEIPAATQLFTPHWIVRYLVENSLGRLWLLNRPNSRLADRMDYYIKPVEEETDFLKFASPEELKIIDPACGSGHMLTYAFDLLYAIYQEEGYAPADIPGLILTHNLFGTEIDPRAGALAAFALTMKARARQRTFFTKQVQPNVCVFEPITFTPAELGALVTVGGDRAAEEAFWNQFQHADTFGSLIQPRADLADVLRTRLTESRLADGDLLEIELHARASRVLQQACYLASGYHVAVANPPYMGSKSMDARLQGFTKLYYPISKADLYSAFIQRCAALVREGGAVAMVTMQSWMFLSSFEKLRRWIIREHGLLAMAHLGANGFDSIGGEVVSTTAFVMGVGAARHSPTGVYIRLIDGSSERAKDEGLRRSVTDAKSSIMFRVTADQFEALPGAQTAYWLSENALGGYRKFDRLGEHSYGQPGLQTSDNARFTRQWYEISLGNFCHSATNSKEAISSMARWFPLVRGGDYRKWYGNLESVVNWKNDGEEIKTSIDRKYPYLNGNIDYVVKDRGYFFRESITYNRITAGRFAVRYTDPGTIFDVAGSAIFPHDNKWGALGFLCSTTAEYLMRAQNPTFTVQSGDVASLPYPASEIAALGGEFADAVKAAVEISREDWNSAETSWSFTRDPLVASGAPSTRLGERVAARLRSQLDSRTRLAEAESRINRQIAGIFGLVNELECDVAAKDVTLRPGTKDSLIRDLVSFAVGCMVGRYSLDEPGLILANQGDTLQYYFAKVPNPSFTPDRDNVIPIVDGEWFEDDIVARFRRFLRVAFGEQHFEENLRFVTESLGVNDLRDYFVRSFYKDHVQRYKKRPIYWLFSSPKGSFNALVYMHRHTPSTVSTVLNEYLREFKAKLEASRQHHERLAAGGGTPRQQAAALKEVDRLRKVLLELDEYEHDVLYPLATQQLRIDLDDGVKVNYPKFGAALKKIPGLEASDE